MTDTPRDRLRELLDAVLDERHHRLEDMASDAFVSPFHFSRVLVRNTGESPARMRRRVMLERGAWNDRLIDALCDPPESFVMSSVIAHVLTYASHRRQLVRTMLRRAGKTVDQGDPIMWLRRINDLQEEQC